MYDTLRSKARVFHTTVFTVLLILATLAPLAASPDLDVAYISREPRYDRYNVLETHPDPKDWGNGWPYLTDAEKAKQRWPNAGAVVTFTAYVKNPGDAATGTFAYKWYFDGTEVASGTLPSIAPGGQVSTTYQWTWDSEGTNHTIKFEADPGHLITEDIETNNSREDRTNALCFHIHVWQSVYNWFRVNARIQDPGLASFDDWIQKQLAYMNQMFVEAVWPHSLDGILERVRLDEIVVHPDSDPDPDPSGTHATPDWPWDCRWGFHTSEYPQIFIDHPEFVSGPYHWVLHEFCHQIGLFDLGNLGMGKDRNLVNPTLGRRVAGSNDMMLAAGAMCFRDYSAYALNSNLHKRRGYCGEYLYDLPTTCKVRTLDAYGNPLPNATVKFYQDHTYYFKPDWDDNFQGVSDSSGLITMPNQTCYGAQTTATGHGLHDSPWNLPHRSGFNGLFYCEITASSQTDYQFIEIVAFNVAYRAGYTNSYTYDLRTSIVPGGRLTTNNLRGIKMASSTLGHIVGDGGKALIWSGTSWSNKSSQTTNNLYAVDTYSTTYAYAVGNSGTVLRYYSGSWSKRTNPTGNPNLRAVAALSSSTVVVGGLSGKLFRSTNGGSSWTSISATSNNINSIDFYDANKGVMVCDGGLVYYSTNGGQIWTLAAGSFTDNMTHCSMPSSTEAWACNNNGDVYESIDGGVTWTMLHDGGYQEPWNCIDMKPGGYGWAGGQRVAIPELDVYSTPCLVRFDVDKYFFEATITSGSSDEIYDVSCVNATEAWIVGKGGLILRLKWNQP